MNIHENFMKIMQIHENSYEFMKFCEIHKNHENFHCQLDIELVNQPEIPVAQFISKRHFFENPKPN